jgi:hypothetical protein
MFVKVSGWQKGQIFCVEECGFLPPIERLKMIGVFMVDSSAFTSIITQRLSLS